MQFKVPVCKSKFWSVEICKRNGQKQRGKTELSNTKPGVKFARPEISLAIITKEKGADVVVIDMPILDTRREKGLLGTFISDLILALLSYVAESEYQTIHQRQAEGIAAAKAKGIKMGRPPKPLPENFYEVYQRWKAGKISTAEASRQVDMPVSTFRYRASVYKNATLSHDEK